MLQLKYRSQKGRVDRQYRTMKRGFGPEIKGITEDDIQIVSKETPGYPGPTSQSYVARYASKGERIVSKVYNTMFHFWILVKGRGEIDQRKKGRKKMLRFVYRGKVIFRWRVGPQAPNDFLLKARRLVLARNKRRARDFARRVVATK